MKKLLTLAALVGVSGVGVANAADATLTGVRSEGDKGTSVWNIAKSTATWDLNTVTGVATQTGGLFSASVSVGKTPLMTHTMSGGVLSSSAASASAWNCVEGAFGGVVGAHICGNFTFGANGTKDSVVGNSGTATTVTLLPDDAASGAPQALTSYDNLVLSNVSGNTWKLTNFVPLTSGYEFTFTVAAGPPPAVAVDDDGGDVLEATAKVINVGGNDTGFTDPVTVTIATNPTKAPVPVTSAPGPRAGQTITYTSSVDASGADSFTYSITDGVNTKTATVTVNIVPFGANPDSAVTTRDQPVVISPGANDAGFDDTIHVTLANGGACTNGGTAAVTAGQDGALADIRITYTPAAIAAGTSGNPVYTGICNYTLDDGVQPTDDADISIAVSNSVPVANDGASSIVTAGVAPADLTAAFTAPGTGGAPAANLGDAPSVVTVTTQGSKGSATVAGNIITYTVSDAAFFTGTDTYTYTVTDLDGETDTGVVTVTIADIAPEITVGTITTTTGTASAPLTPSIIPGNGSVAQHTLAVTTDGTNGSCVLSAGTVVYTSDAGYAGTDACTLTLTDGDGDTDTATINVTVNAVDSIKLPGGSSSMDLWSLSLLGSLPLLMRRRRRS